MATLVIGTASAFIEYSDHLSPRSGYHFDHFSWRYAMHFHKWLRLNSDACFTRSDDLRAEAAQQAYEGTRKPVCDREPQWYDSSLTKPGDMFFDQIDFKQVASRAGWRSYRERKRDFLVGTYRTRQVGASIIQLYYAAIKI